MTGNKRLKRKIRHKRIRVKIKGTAKRPRLSIFKSNKHFFVQLIDDDKGKTITSVSDKEIRGKKNKSGVANELGKLLAKKASDMNLKAVIFDRGGYKFHGKIAELANGAREGGLKF